MKEVRASILSPKDQEYVNNFLARIKAKSLTTEEQFEVEYKELLNHLGAVDNTDLFEHIIIPAYNFHKYIGEDPLTKITFAIKELYSRLPVSRDAILRTTEPLLHLVKNDPNLKSVILTLIFTEYSITDSDFFYYLSATDNNQENTNKAERAELLLQMASDFIQDLKLVNLFSSSATNGVHSILELTIPALNTNQHFPLYEKILSHASLNSLDLIQKIELLNNYCFEEVQKISLDHTVEDKVYSPEFLALLIYKSRACLDELKKSEYPGYKEIAAKTEYLELIYYSAYFEEKGHFLNDDDDIKAGQEFLVQWPRYAQQALENPEHSNYQVRGLLNFISSVGQRYHLRSNAVTTKFIFDNQQLLIRQPEVLEHIQDNLHTLLHPNALIRLIGHDPVANKKLQFATAYFWKDNPQLWWDQLQDIQSVYNIEALLNFTYAHQFSRKAIFLSQESPYGDIKSGKTVVNYKTTRALLAFWKQNDNALYNVSENITENFPDIQNSSIPSFRQEIYDFLIYLQDNYTIDGILHTESLPDMTELDKGFLLSIATRGDLKIFLEVITKYSDEETLLNDLFADLNKGGDLEAHSHFAFIGRYATNNIELFTEDRGYFYYLLVQNVINDTILSDEAKAIRLGVLYDNGYFGRTTEPITRDLTTLLETAELFCSTYMQVLNGNAQDGLKGADSLPNTQNDVALATAKKEATKQRKKHSALKKRAFTKLIKDASNVPDLADQDIALLSNLNNDNVDDLPIYFLERARTAGISLEHQLACHTVALAITETSLSLANQKNTTNPTAERAEKIVDLEENKVAIGQKIAEITGDITVKAAVAKANRDASKIQSIARMYNAKPKFEEKKAEHQNKIENAASKKITSAVRKVKIKKQIEKALERKEALQQFYQDTVDAAIENIYHIKSEATERDQMQSEDVSTAHFNKALATLASNNLLLKEQEVQNARLQARNSELSTTLSETSASANRRIRSQAEEILELKAQLAEQAAYIQRGERYLGTIKKFAGDVIQPSFEHLNSKIKSQGSQIAQLENSLRSEAGKARYAQKSNAFLIRKQQELESYLDDRNARIIQLSRDLSDESKRSHDTLNSFHQLKQTIDHLNSAVAHLEHQRSYENSQANQTTAALMSDNNRLKEDIQNLQQILRETPASGESRKSDSPQQSEKSRFAIKRQQDATNTLLSRLYLDLYMNGIVTIEYITDLKATHDASIDSFNPTLPIGPYSISLDPGYSTTYLQCQNAKTTPDASPYQAGLRTQGQIATSAHSSMSNLTDSTDSKQSTPDKEMVEKTPIVQTNSAFR